MQSSSGKKSIKVKPLRAESRWLAAALALLVLGPEPQALAGPVFFAGRLEEGRFVPAGSGGAPCFRVLFSSTSARLREDRAHTRIDETIAGPEEGSVDAVGLVPLPAGVSEGEVKLLAGGRDLASLGGRFLPADKAREVYEQLARALKRVDLLALADRPALLLPRFSLQARNELTIELERRLPSTNGLYVFDSPMPHIELGRGPAERVTLTVTMQGALPLRGIFSPTHEITVERKGPFDAVVRAGGAHVPTTPDFRLFFAADRDPLGLRVLAHRGVADEEGYFLLLGNPSGEPGQEQALPKDLLLVLDSSGSMRGEKLEQARLAIEYCLERLNPGDRFNLVTFGTEVARFREQPVPGTGANVEAARAFLDEVEAMGRTNIAGALASGLAGPAAGSDRPRIMIFLTDGTPTAGELDPRRIIERLPALNTSNTRIFTLGVGHDVNAHLLDRLAEDSSGSSEYLDPDEEIDVKVAALYDRLSNPVLTQVALGFGGLKARLVYPERLPALFKGSDVLILGRYAGGGEHTLTVSGTMGGSPRVYRVTASFPDKASPDHEFVASLWASRRIGELLAQIRLRGEQEGLVAEVVKLSRAFGIITEYTAFLSEEENQELSDDEAAQEATRRLREANVQQSGTWAVMQAGNEKMLRQKTVATSSVNAFVDRQGKTRVASKVKQVGRRVFYKKEDRWVEAPSVATGDSAAPAAAPAPAHRVQMFSDEYFQLLRSNKDFAKAQSLGGKVTLEVEGKRVEVY